MIKNKYKIYWRYFLYILRHKKAVAIECFKMGLFVHAFTHDLSKFLPDEFFPYAIKFFSGDYAYEYFLVEERFTRAWLLHQRRNKHHWTYWVSSDGSIIPMPEKYIKQMVADWRGMARNTGVSASEYCKKNHQKLKLRSSTMEIIEDLLNNERR